MHAACRQVGMPSKQTLGHLQSGVTAICHVDDVRNSDGGSDDLLLNYVASLPTRIFLV